MLRRSTVAVVSLLTVFATAACSPDQGSTKPETSPQTTAANKEPTDPALRVDNPKNIGSITDACQLLTPEQATQLAPGSTPEPDTTVYDESVCEWVNDDLAIDVALNTTTGTGPEKIHADGASSDNFAPIQVDGYPAARVDKQDNLCRVEVGVSDTESFAVNYTKYGGDAPEMQDPCGYAETVASEVLKNIPNT